MLHYIMAPVLALGLAMPAAAEKLSLQAISNYLNSFKTAQGEFTQINEDGTVSTGQITIKRPGRVRFEYNPPEETLVVSDGVHVGIIDPKSNTRPEAYPLQRTPLKIILANNVDFTRARMVTGHSYDGKATKVRAQDPEHPEYGNIDLVFTGSPVQLRQWVINDGDGSSTTVILGDMKTGIRMNNDKFVVPGTGHQQPNR